MTINRTAGNTVTPPKSPWKEPGTWGLLCFLVLSGAVAGATITQYVAKKEANRQIEAVKAAYDEAGKSRLAVLTMCLNQTKGAATTAASAATDAAEKAEAAQRAAAEAAAAATGSVQPDPEIPR